MIIALMTDFGTRDYFVGAIKGTILSINGKAKIVDISHEIEPQNIASASFILSQVFQDFPPQTIFVAVIDPGVGSQRRPILVKTEKYFFIAPDNGLLSFIFQTHIDFQVFELNNPEYFLPEISKTFHGRDIFAPAAAWLSKGVKVDELGNEIADFIIAESTVPHKISENHLEARIIHIDRFGNLITNLQKQDLQQKFSIAINNQKINKHVDFYAEAQSNELFTIWGSANYLEISAFQNSAQKILGAYQGDKILIHFEH